MSDGFEDNIETLGREELVRRSRLQHRQVTNKPIGLVRVDETPAPFVWTDPVSGLELDQGTPCLEMHMPPRRDFGAIFREMDATFADTARYMLFHRLRPRYILGVTYPRLGRAVARYWGFQLATPDRESVPAAILQHVEYAYSFSAAGRRNLPMGDPVVLFQDRKAFVAEHLSRRAAVGYRALGFLRFLC